MELQFVRPPIVLIYLLVVTAACGQITPTPPSTEESMGTQAVVPTNSPPSVDSVQPTEAGPTEVISKNTQARINDELTIGTGNFWEETYTDTNGVAHYGLTAGLWLSFRNPGGTVRESSHLRVYAGQEVVVDSYQIEVVEIHPEPDAWVKLTVRRLAEVAPP